MERLLSLLLSLFKDLSTVQAILGKLAEKILEGVEEPNGCKNRVLAWLKAGTLDDEFQKDPLCVVICLAYTILALLEKMHGHDHDHPDVILADPDGGYYGELASALELPVPATGPLSDLLYEMLFTRLAEILKGLLEKWLAS